MNGDFTCPVRIEDIGESPREMKVEAGEAELRAVARRLALPALHALKAIFSLEREGAVVHATGRVKAEAVQSCVATGEPLAQTIDAPFEIVFAPQPEAWEEEIELSESECDILFYGGGTIDLGAAVADTLALALDPWPRAPG
ncbi:MAG: DUF177 domain-containing protein [Sphingomonadaceae bacterium]